MPQANRWIWEAPSITSVRRLTSEMKGALVKKGVFAPEVPTNRALMKRLLGAEGLRPYDKEWWHYQERMSMPEVRKRYHLLDF